MSSEPAGGPKPIARIPFLTIAQERLRFPWRLFLLLAALLVVVTALAIPYQIQQIRVANPQVPDDIIGQILTSRALSLGLNLLALLFGLVISRQVGLGAPYLEAFSERAAGAAGAAGGAAGAGKRAVGAAGSAAGAPGRGVITAESGAATDAEDPAAAKAAGRVPAELRRGLIAAVALGLVVGVALLLTDNAIQSSLPAEMTRLAANRIRGVLPNLLFAFEGALRNEIIRRVFFLSLFAWLILRLPNLIQRGIQRGEPVKGGESERSRRAVLWIASALAALFFSLNLLRLGQMNLGIPAGVIAAMIFTDALAAMGYGWLYFTFGLEAAVLAHFLSNGILLVVGGAVAAFYGSGKIDDQVL